MTRINRAAWKRIKERIAEPEPVVAGNIYPGTIKSISIGGHELPVMESDVFEFRDGNRLQAGIGKQNTVTVFKGRSVGATTGLLEQMAELYDVNPKLPDESDAEFRERCARRLGSLVIDAEGAGLPTLSSEEAKVFERGGVRPGFVFGDD